MHPSRYFVALASLTILLGGCGVSVGHQQLYLPNDVVENKYDAIRAIIVEEAANNGYGAAPTSEIKPSKYNNYKGKIYYALTTGAGTDQFTVELKPADDGKVSVYMNGGGTKGDPKGAMKAIAARLEQLGATTE
jgi:hypothetical protein